MKVRETMKVDPMFREKILKIQAKIRKLTGKEPPSQPDLTKKIITNPIFQNIEDSIMGNDVLSFNIKFDGSKL